MQTSQAPARKPMTLEDAVEIRSNCRNGLRGVLISVSGREGVFAIRSTEWDAEGRLRVTASPASSPPSRPTPAAGNRLGRARAVLICAAEVPAVNDPPGTLFDVTASDCFLAGKWPATCCGPRR